MPRPRCWQHRQRVRPKLPLVAGVLYVSAELEMFWIVVGAMLTVGAVWLTLAGDEIRRLRREGDAELSGVDDGGGEGSE